MDTFDKKKAIELIHISHNMLLNNYNYSKIIEMLLELEKEIYKISDTPMSKEEVKEKAFEYQLAKTRRALYNAYVSEGFTKNEAFQLINTELLKINFSIEERKGFKMNTFDKNYALKLCGEVYNALNSPTVNEISGPMIECLSDKIDSVINELEKIPDPLMTKAEAKEAAFEYAKQFESVQVLEVDSCYQVSINRNTAYSNWEEKEVFPFED